MFSKKGKSKRGQWTKAQYEYAQRAVDFGCVACYLGHGIESSPAMWHHQKEGFHGAGMRAPHHHGLPLCPTHHLHGEDSVHRNPAAFAHLIKMSEAEAVSWCWNRFGWVRRTT